MSIFRYVLIALLFNSAAAMAAPATDETIRQLLAFNNTQKVMDGVKGQLDIAMDNAIQKTLNGRTPNPKEQQAITSMKNKTIAILVQSLSQENMGPVFTRIYKDLFTEEELSAFLAFYKTPAGQAMAEKLPILMQRTMAETQKMMQGMTPKMIQIQQEFMAEMKEANN